MADIYCENCGASAPAHSAVCEFCHSSLGASSHTGGDRESSASLPGLMKLYGDGKVQGALGVVNNLYKQTPEIEKDPAFLVLHAKLLLETEGATGLIKLILNKAFVLAPKNADVLDYLAIVEAKEKMDLGLKQEGEDIVRALLRKKPNHPHALLLMGTHLFWHKTDLNEAARYLESCVRARPAMLRGWACLGAVHATSGRPEQAEKAFKKCLELETNPKMVDYFKSMLKQIWE